MGFGQLLTWKVDGVTAKLGHYVVDKFCPEEMVIKVGRRSLKIDSLSIHKLMGVPMGSKKFYAKKLKKRDPAVHAWRKLYPGRFVSPRQCVDHIQSSPDGDTFIFRMDFIICFMSVLVECLSQGSLKEKILKYISADIDWSDINWCEYIIDALRVCKEGWRRMDTTSSFHGPLAILILLYVDSFDCKGMKVDPNQNAITFWTKDNQKRRQKFEKKNGGFGKGKYKGLSNVVDNGSSGIQDLSVGETLSDNVSEVEKNFEIIQNAKEKLDNSLDQLIHLFPQSVEAHSLKQRYDSFFKSHMIWTEEDFAVADIPVQSDHNQDELDDTEDEDVMENEHDTERSEEADQTDDEDDMENEVEHHKENQADDTEEEDHDENDFDDDDGDHHNEDANDVSNEQADDNEDGNDVGNEEGDYNHEVDDDFTEEGVNDVCNEESDVIEHGNDVHNEQGNDNDHVDFTLHANQSSPNTAHDATIQNTTDVGSKVSLVQQKHVISQSPPQATYDGPNWSVGMSQIQTPPPLQSDDPNNSCSTTFLTNQQDMHRTHSVDPNHIISHVLVDLTADATHNESWEETYLVTPRTLFPTEDVATTPVNTEGDLCDEGDLSKSMLPYTPIHTPKAGIPNSMDGVKHVTFTGPDGEVVVALQVEPIASVPTLEKVQEVAEQLNSKRINPFRQPPLPSALRSPYFDRGVILETAFTKEEKKLWDIIMKDPPPTPQKMGKNAAKNKEKILLNRYFLKYSKL
ncbi:hypothetical protein SSX86_000211 [Deinandra increscens subsp. villosa]